MFYLLKHDVILLQKTSFYLFTLKHDLLKTKKNKLLYCKTNKSHNDNFSSAHAIKRF